MLADPAIRAAKALLRADRRARKAERPRMDAGPKLEPTPGEPTTRRFTPKQKADAFARQGGLCPDCGLRFAIGDMELDHEIPLALGGAESATNHTMRCKADHAAKTKLDVARIAKAKRQSKLLGPRGPSKHPIRSRGFQ